MKKFSIAIFASGRGSNLREIISSIKLDPTIEIVHVVSNRGSSKALEIASMEGITNTCTSFGEGKYEYINTCLKANRVDLIVLAGFMKILSVDFVNNWYNRIINIHPSLLPSFPGLNPQRQALDAGVKYSGCTVHFVRSKVDSGPIIAQAVVPVLPDDTEDDLSERILKEEHILYSKVIKDFSQGKIKVINERVVIEG